MYQVKSVNPSGVQIITRHDSAAFAAIEQAMRTRSGHRDIELLPVADDAADMTGAACQHGARNKAQRRAERGMGLGNPMSGG